MIAHFDIITVQPLIALIFGILILIIPRLYLIAIYLIVIGVIGLWPNLFAHAAAVMHVFF